MSNDVLLTDDLKISSGEQVKDEKLELDLDISKTSDPKLDRNSEKTKTIFDELFNLHSQVIDDYVIGQMRDGNLFRSSIVFCFIPLGFIFGAHHSPYPKIIYLLSCIPMVIGYLGMIYYHRKMKKQQKEYLEK
jgi:hypothetical protein